MDDMQAIEQRITRELVRRAGPSEPVDDAAIFTAITATRSPKWRFQSMFSATKFLVAGAIVALFGGFLLSGVLTIEQQGTTAPDAADTRSAEPSDGECGLVGEAEGPLLPGCGYHAEFWGLEVPTTGWVHEIGPEGGQTFKKGVAATIFVSEPTPDGTYADPCGKVRDEPLYVPTDDGLAIIQHSADLVAAMAAIPGIEVVEAPTAVTDGARRPETRNHLVIRVPEDACVPFGLWWDSDMGARWLTRAGDTVRIWIINHPYILSSPAHPSGVVPASPGRLWIEAVTPGDADPELDGEIQQIIDSISTPR